MRRVFPSPWAKLAATRHNVLIEGSRRDIETALGLVERHLTGLVVRRRPEEPLDVRRCRLDKGRSCTLILEDVVGLKRDEQMRLRLLLDQSGMPRVISTATTPVFPLVECGLFDDGLYYRLNVVLVRAGSVDWPMVRDSETSQPVSPATHRSDGGR